ncbi:MAG: hypothetical protein Q9167_005944 [Letrouitia subvulpina]
MPTTFVKRPASLLRFEPLRPYDEEIICPGSDLEETYEKRQSKRRRIEAAGRQYLEGRQLFILSAQLKGPFGDGWVNPWAPAPKLREIEDTLDRRIQDRSSAARGDRNHEIADEDPQYSQEQSNDHMGQQNKKGWLKSRGDPLHSRHGPKSRSPTPTPKPKSHTKPNGTTQTHSEANIVFRRKRPPSDGVISLADPSTALHTTRHQAPTAGNTTRLSNDQSEGQAQRFVSAESDQGCIGPKRVSQPSAHNVSNEAENARDAVHKTKEPRTTRVLPPSTYQPEFQYRFGSKRSSRSPEPRLFTDGHGPAKEKELAEIKSKICFTASESLKGQSPNFKGQETNPKRPKGNQHSIPQKALNGNKCEPSPQDTSVDERGELPTPYSEEKQSSRGFDALPEAQIVQDPVRQLPSGLSTGLLETDKKSSKSLKSSHVDGYDRYADLSTQAALVKAQQSFRESISPPTSPGFLNPSPKQVDEPTRINTMTGEVKRAEAQALERSPPRVCNELMSTQAIVDAISPFPETTVKKNTVAQKRTSFARSPSRAASPPSPLASEFRTKSLSMSTSPSPPLVPNDEPWIPFSALSKPPSTITSFSIGPNGSLTEVFQQEGQHQNFDMDDWDLDAAIEEAGSFLGEWDLEAEARKEGRASLGSKENTNTTKRGAFSNRSRKEH